MHTVPPPHRECVCKVVVGWQSLQLTLVVVEVIRTLVYLSSCMTCMLVEPREFGYQWYVFGDRDICVYMYTVFTLFEKSSGHRHCVVVVESTDSTARLPCVVARTHTREGTNTANERAR